MRGLLRVWPGWNSNPAVVWRSCFLCKCARYAQEDVTVLLVASSSTRVAIRCYDALSAEQNTRGYSAENISPIDQPRVDTALAACKLNTAACRAKIGVDGCCRLQMSPLPVADSAGRTAGLLPARFQPAVLAQPVSKPSSETFLAFHVGDCPEGAGM